MADLAQSAVNLLDNWTGGGNNGKRWAYRKVILTLDGQGDATDTIDAGVLGLQTIEGCSPVVKSDNSVVLIGAASYTGLYLLLCATASDAPAVQTGTFKCTVWGNS